MTRNPRLGRALALGVGFVVCLANTTAAFDLPVESLLLSPRSRWIGEETSALGRSFVRLQYTYWDVYHESSPVHLHDYRQQAMAARALTWRGDYLVGLEWERDDLDLQQENVYSDSDRMRADRDPTGARLIGGVERRSLGSLEKVRLSGAVGWRLGGSGWIETGARWRSLELGLRAETFCNRVDVSQRIAGLDVPLRFSFRTQRCQVRLNWKAPRNLDLAAWGEWERDAGDSEPVQDFSNRVSAWRGGAGLTASFLLEPASPLYIVVRRLRSSTKGPGVRALLDHRHTEVDLDMFNQGTRYLHLDNLRAGHTMARLDVAPVRKLCLFAGWERVGVEHYGSSFADVWPFTVWDIFEAKRYRLDKTDIHLDTWFAGTALLLESNRFDLELSARVEKWRDAGMFDWLERFDVVFPFFFRYERHSEPFDLGVDRALQIDAAVWFRASSRTRIRLFVRATVPFQTEVAEKKPPGEGGGGAGGGDERRLTSQHGGILGRVEVILSR